MSTNTPEKPDYGEPWTYEAFNASLGDTGDYEGVALLRTRYGHLIAEKHSVDDIDEDHLSRAAACVNACAGMADPAKEIEAMGEAIKAAHGALEYVMDELCTARSSEKAIDAIAKLEPFIKP